jgi:hypothetical protein
MYNGRAKSKSNGDGTVSFPALQCWNPMTKVATIAAEVDGRRVLCRISAEVLEETFGPAETEDPMQIVVENRATIEAAARRLIDRQAHEEGGGILLGRGDLTSPS